MQALAYADLSSALGDAVGPQHVSAAPDLDIAGLRPQLLVRPGSAAEIATCLRLARKYECGVVPWGGGTLQRVGFPPERLDVVLDCSRLAGVVDWEPADLTAGILAGTTLAAAQSELARNGQQVAVDAPVADRATVGGLVAANVAGPRRWLYGGWRDQVIGMEMALTSGDLIKTGGRVVKNVQGYDLSKLFTGALGTLGVITRINVRLIPLPAAHHLIVARGGMAELDLLLAEVAGSTFHVATLDLLDAAAATACGLDADGGAALLLLEGSRASVEGQTARLTHLARSLGLSADTVEDHALASLWERRLHLDRVDDLSEGEARLRAAVLPSAVLGAMTAIRSAAEERGLAARCWAEAGVGTVSARVAAPGAEFGPALQELQAELITELSTLAVACGDPVVQRAVRPWGDEPQGLELMRSLKQRFDSTATLQPGRYVGGI